MQDAIRVFAGRSTVTHEAAETSTREGELVTVIKPDNTVLVHDTDGYRPAGWLTRADSLRISRTGEQVELAATKDGERLAVSIADAGFAEFPATPAGSRVGTCPSCQGTLVRRKSTVTCLCCGEQYRLPRDADVTDRACEECGLPRISVDRGASFEVCLDRACQSIDEAVAGQFDGNWSCPACETPLEIKRERRLQAACPNCGEAYPVPTGVVDGECACGLPTVETPGGTRCLDPACSLATGAH
ncbi:MAG: DUF91 domain-containing protein [Halodesulfurarchaeum sp.]